MPSTPIDQRLRPVTGLMKTLPAMFGIRLDEELKYYVVLREGEMQIRKYRPFILAQTMVRGEFDVARELGMRRLQHFLQGHNDFREKIILTTPIFQSRGDKISFDHHREIDREIPNWVMGVILPSRFGIGNMPHPLEKNIKLMKIPSLIVGTCRYSGINNEDLMDKKTHELMLWLDKQPKYKTISEPRFAQYDATLAIPLFRRNEIQITLTETEMPQKKFH